VKQLTFAHSIFCNNFVKGYLIAGRPMTHETLQLEAVSPIRFHVPTQVIVFITTTLLVCISVVLFMMDTTSGQVGTLLTAQNAASLKLWSIRVARRVSLHLPISRAQEAQRPNRRAWQSVRHGVHSRRNYQRIQFTNSH
jgi:hypothetical protein